jgi:tetratricopeptide (TPR) repeat protein
MGGIGAGLIYLGLVGFIGWRAWRALRAGRVATAGIALGVIAYGVQQLFLFPLAELDPIWWLFAGIVVASTTSPADDRVERTTTVVPVLAGVAALVMLVAGVLDVAADRLARTALRAGDHDAAVDAADRAVSLRPDNIRYRLVAAEVRLDRATLADIDHAIVEARRATDWSSEDPFATEELARAMSQRAAVTGDSSDIAKALSQWQRLVRRDPHRASWQLQLGRAAALSGDVELARQAWTIADDLGEPGAAALLHALEASS